MEIITENLGAILQMVVPAVIAFFVGRRKAKAETSIVEGNAVKNMQEAYDNFTADANERYESLKKDLVELQQKLNEVEKYWKTKYTNLKREFNEYKSKHP